MCLLRHSPVHWSASQQMSRGAEPSFARKHPGSRVSPPAPRPGMLSPSSTATFLPPRPAGFITYSLCGYPLTASVAFPALALFNLLRFPVMMFPVQVGARGWAVS